MHYGVCQQIIFGLIFRRKPVSNTYNIRGLMYGCCMSKVKTQSSMKTIFGNRNTYADIYSTFNTADSIKSHVCYELIPRIVGTGL